ncbi:hypothetical protein [Flavobacterium macacae]|uniref:Uncharacterized protein n=1 Tax=Flavobacterium macacae TaxID=2488993 RepID=A0A3P3WF21_9FLAO|nr:hypothetical protein [Flavobacterium macacae]RRJ93741.1 hypothetical protein EG849_02570 [Flavobacterium macacae]
MGESALRSKIGIDFSFSAMVQKFKKMAEVSQIAPIGSSSSSSSSSLFFRLRRKATAESGENGWLKINAFLLQKKIKKIRKTDG